MSAEIKFGTDGWRGKIAEDYTFDNVRRVAQAFASYLLEHAGKVIRAMHSTAMGSRTFKLLIISKLGPCWLKKSKFIFGLKPRQLSYYLAPISTYPRID